MNFKGDSTMNEEKKIAQAITDAIKMHEESYHTVEGHTYGEYRLEIEDCLIEACKKHELSKNLWALLNLATHWFNDIQLWAEDALAGRNILDMVKTRDAVDDSECKEVKNVSPFNH